MFKLRFGELLTTSETMVNGGCVHVYACPHVQCTHVHECLKIFFMLTPNSYTNNALISLSVKMSHPEISYHHLILLLPKEKFLHFQTEDDLLWATGTEVLKTR